MPSTISDCINKEKFGTFLPVSFKSGAKASLGLPSSITRLLAWMISARFFKSNSLFFAETNP